MDKQVITKSKFNSVSQKEDNMIKMRMFFIKEGIKEFFEPFAFAFWVLFLGTIVALHWIYEKLAENGMEFIQL